MSTSADAVLSVRTQYDGSSLNAGMKESSVTVQTSSSQMADALRGVVSSNNALADSINKVVSIRATERTGSEASRAAAKEEAAAKRELAAQTREATHAAHLFGMETGVEIPRALRGVLAHSSIVGPALAAMFPMLAAVGFAAIIVKAAQEAYEWGKQGYEAAAKISEGFAVLHQQAELSNAELAVTNDKLAIEIAKLQGKPGDGLKLALDESTVAALKLTEQLHKAFEEQQKVLKENGISAAKGWALTIIGGSESTNAAEAFIKLQQDGIADLAARQARAVAEAKTEDERKRIVAENRIAMEKALTDAAIATGRASLDYNNKGVSPNGNLTYGHNVEAPVAALDNAQRGFLDQRATIRATNTGSDQEHTKDRLQEQAQLNAEAERQRQDDYRKSQEDARQALEGQIHVDQGRIKSFKEALEKQKGDHVVSEEEEAAYWTKIALRAKAGSVEQGEAFRLAATARAAATRQEQSELDKANAFFAEQAQKQQKASQELVKLAADRAMASAKSSAALTEEQIKSDLATGRTTALGAAMLTAQNHAREYALEIAHLRNELSALNSMPDSDPQKKVKQKEVQNKIDAVGDQSKLTGAKDQQAIAQQLAAPYQKAAQLITSSFNAGLNTWITGQKKFGAAMQQAWRSVAMGAIQNIEKMGEKLIQQEILTLAKKKETAAVSKATDVEGAATSVEVSAAAAMKKQLHHAANAAGGAYDAFADIPIVGPALGAIAAAATFTAVMALAAFEQGGIAGDGMRLGTAVPIIAHAGERILTTSQTQQFDSMVNNSSSSSPMNWNQTNHFHGSSDDQFRSQLLKHSSAVFRAGQRHLRQMGKG